MILTIIDTAGIQDYIFHTNKLQQIVGASYLINCASREWVRDALDEAGLKHNIQHFDDRKEDERNIPVFSDARIETASIQAELIYAGGGNTLLLFENLKTAEQFTRYLTRRIIRDAPGLRLVISHSHDFDWENEALGGEQGVLQHGFMQMTKRKSSPQPVTSEPGWGVTVECSFSALPCVDIDKGRAISAEVQAKLEAETPGFNRLKDLISFRQYLEPLRNFDDLGRSEGEKSLLAVVHADGNRMGKRVSAIQNRYSSAVDNRECVQALRAFSLSIQRAAIHALQSTVDAMIAATDQEGKIICGEIEILEDRLPFRPLVFGGDDLTFVCDGRLGLSLAAYYLKAAAEQKLSDGGKLICRAGVAIVKTHYPFARAYGLAEELCQSAKKIIADIKNDLEKSLELSGAQISTVNPEVAAIDWHFALTGVLDSLDTIREREYSNKTGMLTMRPLAIVRSIEFEGEQEVPEFDSDWRTWQTFIELVDSFKNDERWANRHNKVKAFRQVLREGQEPVKHFCINYNAALPAISGRRVDRGWVGDHCAYFDPIEALDVFIPLAEPQVQQEVQG